MLLPPTRTNQEILLAPVMTLAMGKTPATTETLAMTKMTKGQFQPAPKDSKATRDHTLSSQRNQAGWDSWIGQTRILWTQVAERSKLLQIILGIKSTPCCYDWFLQCNGMSGGSPVTWHKEEANVKEKEAGVLRDMEQTVRVFVPKGNNYHRGTIRLD
jgi:hypothetical protein